MSSSILLAHSKLLRRLCIVLLLFVSFVLCSVLGVPLSWRKTASGDTVSWVGFELLHRSYKIGLSDRRAHAGYVHMSRKV